MNPPIATLLAQKASSVLSVPPQATVEEAVRLMRQHRTGSVVVLENGRLTGIFTERDVLNRVVAEGLAPGSTSIEQVMTRDPKTVSPDLTVQDALAFISEKRVRHLPVVENDQLLGLVSQGDITRWLVQVHKAEAEHLMNYITGGASS